MGTFGTNRIYTVGRVVKVEDLKRFERFAPCGFDSLRISNAKFIRTGAKMVGDININGNGCKDGGGNQHERERVQRWRRTATSTAVDVDVLLHLCTRSH